MQNSKAWVIPVKIIAFLLVCVLMAEGLGALVYPKTGETTPKMVEYEHRTDSPDILMLGTSAMYHAIVPLLLEDITGQDCADLCTPAQTMLSSYTLLVESIDQGKIPDAILLYTNIRRFCRERGSNYDYQVMANLPFGYNKLRMLVNGFELEDWPEAMLKAVRGRENFNLKKINANLHADYVMKSSTDGAPEEYLPYLGEGYGYETDAQIPDAVILDSYDEFYLDAVDTTYFDRIVDLCNKHDIDLIMMCVPRLPASIIYSEDYDGFHQYMQQISEVSNIQFWDLTYIRPEYMEVSAEHFRDCYHGNSSFAFPFTKILGTMLNEHFSGTLDLDQYLYDDYETYLQLHKGVNGLFLKDKLYNTSTLKNYLNVDAALGADTVMEIRVSVAPKDSEDFTLFMDWSETNRVVFGNDLAPGKYQVKIEARQIGSEAVEQTIIKTYTIK